MWTACKDCCLIPKTDRARLIPNPGPRSCANLSLTDCSKPPEGNCGSNQNCRVRLWDPLHTTRFICSGIQHRIYRDTGATCSSVHMLPSASARMLWNTARSWTMWICKWARYPRFAIAFHCSQRCSPLKQRAKCCRAPTVEIVSNTVYGLSQSSTPESDHCNNLLPYRWPK